jgi:hypothetical protein
MERGEYLKTFPSYCKQCQGWGIQRSFSPVVRIWECDCLNQSICPRCGAKDVIQDSLACRFAAGTWTTRDRGLPGSEVV